MTKIGIIAVPASLALVASIGLGIAAQTPKRSGLDDNTQSQPARAAAKSLPRGRPAIDKQFAPKKDPGVLATEAKLREKISVDFDKQSLSEAITFIQNYSGLNITIDPKALSDEGPGPSSPVTLSARDVQLKTVLKLILRPLGLTCVPEDDVLLITKPQENRLRTGSAPKDYVIEPPDLLIVKVLEALPGRPLSGERLVRPDGKISLGFYGEVYVTGLTPEDAKEKIIVHLKKYLSDEALGLADEDGNEIPIDENNRISVDISAYNSKVYYVQGAFAAPGRLNWTGRDNVLDAVNYAGGLMPAADHSEVFLYRKSPAGGPPKKLRVDIDEVLFGSDNSTNFDLEPGDRLVALRKGEVEPKIAQLKHAMTSHLPNPDRLLTREEWSSLTTEQKLDVLGVQVIELRSQLNKLMEKLDKP